MQMCALVRVQAAHAHFGPPCHSGEERFADGHLLTVIENGSMLYVVFIDATTPRAIATLAS
jgi:hypothetical protein